MRVLEGFFIEKRKAFKIYPQIGISAKFSTTRG